MSLSHGLRLLLLGDLVVVVTAAMAMAMMMMVVMAIEEAVAEQHKMSHGQGDAMQWWYNGDKARACAADNAGTSATAEQFAWTWAVHGANGGVGLAGLIRRPGGRVSMVSSGQEANAPVSLDPLGLAGMVMNTNTDAWEVQPRGGALPVVSAALAMAKDTTSIKSAGKAEKAITTKSEALEPGAYGKVGSRCKWPLQGKAGHGTETPPQEGYVRTWKENDQGPLTGTHLWSEGVRPWMELGHHHKRVSKRVMDRKEGDQARGAHKLEIGGVVRTQKGRQ